jgi:hypothetical protein
LQKSLCNSSTSTSLFSQVDGVHTFYGRLIYLYSVSNQETHQISTRFKRIRTMGGPPVCIVFPRSVEAVECIDSTRICNCASSSVPICFCTCRTGIILGTGQEQIRSSVSKVTNALLKKESWKKRRRQSQVLPLLCACCSQTIKKSFSLNIPNCVPSLYSLILL